MHRYILTDDLDVLEPVGHESELWHVIVVHADGFITRDRAVDAANEQIQMIVTVDIGDERNVLPVSENRRPGRIPQGIDRQDEIGLLWRALVPEIPHVTEAGLAENVHVAVAVQVQ